MTFMMTPPVKTVAPVILIADDDPAVRTSLTLLLKRAGYATVDFAEPAAVMDFVRRTAPDAVILDMNFTRETTGKEGLMLLRQIRLFQPGVPVILITGWGSIDLAVAGMRDGAFDFVNKPWNNQALLDSISSAIALSKDEKSAEADMTSRAQLDKQYRLSDVVGKSPALMSVLKTIVRIRPINASALITGEPGTGKGVIARAIHDNSPRSESPFVKVNVGGISHSLFEAEMFGRKTGGKGYFAQSDGGTIFFDEIGELDLASQAKLLRALQEQSFEIPGDGSTQKFDARVICATSRNLPAMIEQGLFREELFYRIGLVQIQLPALRERGDDTALLAQSFANRFAEAVNLPLVSFSDDALQLLASRDFPGNIRELKDLVEQVVRSSGTDRITADDFTRKSQSQGQAAVDLQTILETMKTCRGNMAKAAQALGMSRGELYRKLDKYGVGYDA